MGVWEEKVSCYISHTPTPPYAHTNNNHIEPLKNPLFYPLIT